MVLKYKPLDSMLETIKYDKIISLDSFSLDDFFPGSTKVAMKYFFSSDGYWGELMTKLEQGFHQSMDESIGHSLENAFLRGNEGVGYLPVSLTLFSGRKGKIVRIRDNGKGFDFKRKINQMRSGETDYYYGKGRGLKVMDRSWSVVSYESNGSIVNIMLGFPYQLSKKIISIHGFLKNLKPFE